MRVRGRPWCAARRTGGTVSRSGNFPFGRKRPVGGAPSEPTPRGDEEGRNRLRAAEERPGGSTTRYTPDTLPHAPLWDRRARRIGARPSTQPPTRLAELERR